MTKLSKYDRAYIAEKLSDFWSLISPDDQATLAEHLDVRKFKRNEKIYREYQCPEKLLCLISGKVKIYRDGLSGKSLINRVLNPVEYFGYRAYLAHESYVTAAAAFEETTIVALPMLLISPIMEHNPKLANFFVKRLAVDLGRADERIVSITQKHLAARLAEALLSLWEIYGVDPEEQTIDLQIARQDLADFSNMNTTNAIRTLRQFAKQNLVEIHGRQIRLLDIPKLQDISIKGSLS